MHSVMSYQLMFLSFGFLSVGHLKRLTYTEDIKKDILNIYWVFIVCDIFYTFPWTETIKQISLYHYLF